MIEAARQTFWKQYPPLTPDNIQAVPRLLQKASLQTLRKLMTAHVRADRFSEGHLAAMFESGHIARILKRMAEIHASEVSGDQSSSKSSSSMRK